MKKHLLRALALLAIVVLGIALPACESINEEGYTSTTVYVGVGYGVYGGYYGPGWGTCCVGGVYGGGVIVGPPIGVGARPMPY